MNCIDKSPRSAHLRRIEARKPCVKRRNSDNIRPGRASVFPKDFPFHAGGLNPRAARAPAVCSGGLRAPHILRVTHDNFR